MRNVDVCHNFFYSEKRIFSRSRMNVSYTNDNFFSYSTCIGKRIKDSQDNYILIVASNKFSVTTAIHLNELRYACPYDKIIELPQNWYSDDFYPSNVLKQIKECLETNHLSKKSYRYDFVKSYNVLFEIVNLPYFSNFKDEINSLIDIHKVNLDKVNQIEEKRKEQNIKRKENELIRLHERLKEFKDLPLLEKIKMAYGDYYYDKVKCEWKIREAMRKVLNPNYNLSFAWLRPDEIVTSQYVKIPKIEAIRMLKLWKNKELKKGMKLHDTYIVKQISDNFVQIGCHTLPIDNILALCEELKI